MPAPLDSQYDVPNLSASGPYYAQPLRSQAGETSTAALASLLQAELTEDSASTTSTDPAFLPQSPSRHEPQEPNAGLSSTNSTGYHYAARSSTSGQGILTYGQALQGLKRSLAQLRTPEISSQSPNGSAASGVPDAPEAHNKKLKTDGQPKKVGRPRKPDDELRRPRYTPREKPTRLRINKPLKTDINEDVWRHIFRYTEPATLLAMRSVCRTFNTILSHEDYIWQENRRNLFGNNCPDPPPGLPAALLACTDSERTTTPVSDDGDEETSSTPKGVQRQYLDLLAGRNCMNCGAKKTKKTLWAFLRRWCEKCYKSKTVPIASLKIARNRDPTLYLCIPRALSDKWGSYKAVGTLADDEDDEDDDDDDDDDENDDDNDDDDWGPMRLLEHHVFLRNDVTKLLREYDMFCESLSHQSREFAAEMKEEWMQKRIEAVDQQLMQCKKIENFVEDIWDGLKEDEMATRSFYSQQRLEFFADKASQLDPPMSSKALEKIPALQKALKEVRPPTNRAWMNLQSKIEQSRAAAEEAVEFELHSKPASRLYPQKDELRKSDRSSSSLPFILGIASEVIGELSQTNIADVDFPHVALRRVWEVYNLEKAEEELPRASEADLLSPTVKEGPHVLTLHDALKVYDSRIVQHMDKWGPIRSRTAQKLKCPGCTRVDYSKEWSFKALFRHLQDRHGQELGSDWISFHRAAITYKCRTGFPYYAIPWTRNLPILAQHQTATGRWDPDDSSPYKHAPQLTLSEISTPSAFTGRIVRSSTCDVLSVRSLATWVVEATNLLRATSLPKKHIALIAWNYMVRRGRAKLYTTNATITNPLERNYTLNELLEEMMTLGEYSVFDGYSCAACNDVGPRRGRSATTVHYGLKGHPFCELIRHWLNWHTVHESSWYSPSDESDGEEEEEGDQEEEAKVRDKWSKDLLLLPTEGELTDVLRTAGMEDARDVFEWLFPIEPAAVNVLRDPNVFVNRPELAAPSSFSPAPQQEQQITMETDEAVDSKVPLQVQQSPFDAMVNPTQASRAAGRQRARPPPAGAMTESSGLELLADSALRDELRRHARAASDKATEAVVGSVEPQEVDETMAG